MLRRSTGDPPATRGLSPGSVEHNKETGIVLVIEDKRDARILALVDDLANRDPAIRRKARETLVYIGKPAVPSLIELLSHPKPHVRWEAAKTLCGIADPIAATALVNALNDPDEDVRWVAGEGVVALGRDGLNPFLTTLLERAGSYSFREGAHHVCYALIRRKGLGPLLRPLWAALEHARSATGVPMAAYAVLSKLRESALERNDRVHTM
ncbi:MAG: HEAT repeat domain-containing protein [Thermoguttaceae bacterium]